MKNEVIKFDAPELQGVEASKADQIKATFQPMAEMLKGFEVDFKEVIAAANKEVTAEVTVKAKELRIKISKVRIEADKIRKAQKEEYLRAGKAIDGVNNILKWAVMEKEDRLKKVENYFIEHEQKRLDQLQAERVEELSKYVDDAEERSLSNMDSEVWAAFLGAKKKEHEDRIAAEKKAEAERLQ